MPRGSITANRLAMELADKTTHERALKEVFRALDKESGNAVQAAARLGVGHRTLRYWANRYPIIQERLDTLRSHGQRRRRRRKHPAP